MSNEQTVVEQKSNFKCSNCGGTNVQAHGGAWFDPTTGTICDDDESCYDDTWCGDCSAHWSLLPATPDGFYISGSNGSGELDPDNDEGDE